MNNMNISAFSIKNPLPIIMFFILATLLGLMSFNSLKVQNFPDMNLPTITVAATLPGAAPEQLETEVAKKIENSIAPIEGIKNITTKIQDGIVSIVAEFELETDAQQALDDVRSSISAIRSQLPGDMKDPVINKVNMSGGIVASYAISSKILNEQDLSWFVDNNLSKNILSVKGVGAFNRVGGLNREIQVIIDPLKINALGITTQEVSKQLKQLQLDLTAGKMSLGNSDQPIKTIATVKTVQELEKIYITTNKGLKVQLSEIAQIVDTNSEQSSGAYLNGKAVVGFEVNKAKNYGEIEVYESVTKEIKKILKDHNDIEIIESFNFVEPVQTSYQDSMNLLYEGALLAVIVVWLFLRDWRATLVSAIALPLSIIPVFILMLWFDFSLNIITLLSLSLVVGILVDDAIVEVENIERHMEMGKTPYEAALEATQEIGLAVVATTFTLIAVFLPTAFMPGIPGLFFKQFGWTAALAIFASLVVARLLTPLMAAYVMKAKPHVKKIDPKWLFIYISMIKWTLENKIKTLFFVVMFFVLSLMMIPLLPSGFIPPSNSSQTQITLELEPGIKYEQTKQIVLKATSIIEKIKDVDTIYATIGANSSGSKGPSDLGSLGETRKASIILKLKPLKLRKTKVEIENEIREKLKVLPGTKVKVGTGGSGEKYILTLVSDEKVLLQEVSNNIEEEMRTISGIGNISSTASLNRKEIKLNIDSNKAAEYGINTLTIAETIRIATQGDYDTSLSKLNSSLRQIPIIVKLPESFKENIANLESLMIQSRFGMLPLSEVVSIEISSDSAVIDRYNRMRNINIEIELAGIEIGELNKKINDLESIKSLPDGVEILSVGDAERMKELFGGFGLAMVTGILCIYMILVLLFKDIFQPITILTALPLSLGGAFVALLLTNQSFSMPSLIGLIMLMGIATKNSILLVDYVIIARKEGVARYEALIDACHKRARPIIMTTLAMGVGMLPVAAQWGSGDGTFRAPMAIAVIGGLITSTILSLLVIPVIYTYVDDFLIYLKRLVFKK